MEGVMKLSPAVLLIAVLITACVQTKYTLVNPGGAKYDPVPPDEVWLVTSETELDTLQYVRLAIIEATGSGEWTNQTGMLDAIRKQAGKLGANAVLLPQINEPGAGAKVAAAVFGTGTQRKGSAIAIRVIGPKAPSQKDSQLGYIRPLPVVRITVE
jgi:hypothetical protein